MNISNFTNKACKVTLQVGSVTAAAVATTSLLSFSVCTLTGFAIAEGFYYVSNKYLS